MQSDMHMGEPRDDTASPLRLLIASEVRFLRDSLGEILGRNLAMRVIGHAQDSGQILSLSHELRPDMVLLDAAVRDGIAVVRQLRETMSRPRVVVFAVSESVESVVDWAEAGVAGYIPSSAALADLNALVTDIVAGRQACSGSVSAGLIQRIAAATVRSDGQKPSATKLTRREFEIVSLIGAGFSNKEISRRLNIGVATTKSHVHSVLNKLNVHRRGQAANWTRTMDR
jgi:two-component system, NarL family, nitrate/nitrite response regulator NarL